MSVNHYYTNHLDWWVIVYHPLIYGVLGAGLALLQPTIWLGLPSGKTYNKPLNMAIEIVDLPLFTPIMVIYPNLLSILYDIVRIIYYCGTLPTNSSWTCFKWSKFPADSSILKQVYLALVSMCRDDRLLRVGNLPKVAQSHADIPYTALGMHGAPLVKLILV